MKNIKRFLSVVLALAMLLSLAACGGGNTDAISSEATSSVDDTSKDPNVTTSIPDIEDFSGHVSINPSDSLNPENETGVRYDKDYNLLYKPEDVGELSNPIVRGLLTPAPTDEWYAQEYAWKEEAYGIEYDMDVCAWAERDMKLVASYVGGTAYDVLTRVNFPTVVVKGLLEPLDEYLPIEDERYFEPRYVWNGHTYGMRTKSTNYTYRDCGELYGVWYNANLFEDNGLETPLELWEKGEWTIEKMIELAEQLTYDVDRDGINDVFGYNSWAKQLFTIGNGASTVEFVKGEGVSLTWDTPAYIHGLEYIVQMAPYSTGKVEFITGNVAMYGERIQCARYYSPTSPFNQANFEAVWVPFPKGKDGYGVMGSISLGSELVCIGKGAKNIEGAKVWICADICKFDYVDPSNASMMIGVDDETLQRALSCEPYIMTDYHTSIGNMQGLMYKVWDELIVLGPKAAIEKYTHKMQEQIDIVMADTSIE